jgi:hypothetical protein
MNIKEVQESIDKMKQEISSLEKFIKSNKTDPFSVTTYAEVCKRLGECEIDSSVFAPIIPNREELVKAAKRDQLQRFFNLQEDGTLWKTDWNNLDQQKWYPIWIKNSSGLEFLSSTYSYHYFYGAVAYYRSNQISDHIGKYFADLY